MFNVGHIKLSATNRKHLFHAAKKQKKTFVLEIKKIKKTQWLPGGGGAQKAQNKTKISQLQKNFHHYKPDKANFTREAAGSSITGKVKYRVFK